MSNYTNSIPLAPKTLTEGEQKKLLQVTGEHRDGFRDHVLFSLALGTALREHELVALNVGDVMHEDGRVRTRFPLQVFKRSNTNASMQEAVLPDAARAKIEKFLRWKKQSGESIALDAPLFVSSQKKRLATRSVRYAFAQWQKRAGFERSLSFHSLRHTALTNLYRKTKDILVVQKIARHASIRSTTIYAQPSDDDVLKAVKGMVC